MKYNKFPEGFICDAQVIYRDKLLCFLNKLVGSRNEIFRECVLFDPFEEVFFGHRCKIKSKYNDKNHYQYYGREVEFYIGLNPQTPLLFIINSLRINPSAVVPFYIDVFFNPEDGQYLKIQNSKYLTKIETNFSYYYEKNFLAYIKYNASNWDWDSWDRFIDVDIRQQVSNFNFENEQDLVIVQPKISNTPKVFKLNFEPNNVFKHPTEPMLIAYDTKQYIIIDLDI